MFKAPLAVEVSSASQHIAPSEFHSSMDLLPGGSKSRPSEAPAAAAVGLEAGPRRAQATRKKRSGVTTASRGRKTITESDEELYYGQDGGSGNPMSFDRLLPSPPPYIRDGSSTSRRRRTADDFLSFCTIVLDYENYEKSREEDRLRLRHSSSPLGSTGSSIESFQSKEEDIDIQNTKPGDGFEDDEDDDWSVTCYCGKPYGGRPMVECTRCLTWVHLKCAGLKNAHIKGNWYCVKCSNSKAGDQGSGIKGKKSSSGEGRKRKASASLASPEAAADEDYGEERTPKLASR